MAENAVQLFESKKIRTAWDENKEEWYFSVVDVVSALTESADPKQYIKKMRNRDEELNFKWGTICTPVKMIAANGRNGTVYVGTTSNLARRITQHKSDETEGFTQKYSVHRLVWYEFHETMQDAIAAEKKIKNRDRKFKTELIEKSNPYWNDLPEETENLN